MSNHFTRDVAKELVNVLRAIGHSDAVAVPVSGNESCGDSLCGCSMPKKGMWKVEAENVSNTFLHRIAVEDGLIAPKGRRDQKIVERRLQADRSNFISGFEDEL